MTATDRLQRLFAPVNLPTTAAGLVVGALLADVHAVLLMQLNGGAEPPQWLGRVTVLLYWVILPVAMLALWARARAGLGALGRIGAWLTVPLVPVYALITSAALIWGGALGHGDLPPSVTWLESATLAFYLGVLCLGVAFARLSGSARIVGALLLTGLVGSFVIPGVLTVAFSALAVALLRTHTGRGHLGGDMALRARAH